MSEPIEIDDKKSKNESEEEEILIPEGEISEDKYQIIKSQESNIIANKLIQLLEEKFLSPINKFNKDFLKKFDKENIFDQECLDKVEPEIDNFKQSYIETQFKQIKELISKYNLIENVKALSEEKTFDEELNSYNINGEIFSFIGPLSDIINEINKNRQLNGKEDESLEIEKALFQLVEINYYNKKTYELEEKIKELDFEIEDLKNKNKLI